MSVNRDTLLEAEILRECSTQRRDVNQVVQITDVAVVSEWLATPFLVVHIILEMVFLSFLDEESHAMKLFTLPYQSATILVLRGVVLLSANQTMQ